MRKQWLILIGVAALTLFASDGLAQERADDTRHEYALDVDSQQTSPELYYYLDQQRRHDDPQLSVRANAERRASQRRQRIASRKWYGLSNARPLANPTPWYGTYSPMWSGSFWNPFVWTGYHLPAYVILTHNVSQGF